MYKETLDIKMYGIIYLYGNTHFISFFSSDLTSSINMVLPSFGSIFNVKIDSNALKPQPKNQGYGSLHNDTTSISNCIIINKASIQGTIFTQLHFIKCFSSLEV